MLLVAGSYAVNSDPSIYLYLFDEEQGFDLLKVVTGVENPSYLTVSSDGKTLFSISEIKEVDESRLFAYSLNERTLTFKGQLSYLGAGSCFVTVDENCQHAFIANYGSGTLTVLNLKGSVPTSIAQSVEFTGSGPNVERQEQPHIHAVVLTPNQRFLYCTDLGADHLYRFRYNANNDIPLTPCDPPYSNLPAGSGPRHLAFDDRGRWLYLLSELSGEIFKFSVNEPLTNWVEQISTVSADYSGPIEAADIQLHPTGKFLYTSNRGDANEVIVFSIDRRNGSLTFLERVSAEGSGPRSLVISPNGKMLLVANEQSDNISIFRIAADGTLKYTGNELKLSKPTCVKFIINPF